MNALDRVSNLLTSAGSNRRLPPTALFNEGWMLRLILDWCESYPTALPDFTFLPGSTWYSEALLPSRFLGRGSNREGFTHADGVIGHFRFRPGGRGDVELKPNARQLSVIEAKMGSLLSAGTRHAPTYNQAARNVACIAHMVATHGAALTKVEFTVLAPRQRIKEGAFSSYLTAESLRAVVRERCGSFDEESIRWHDSHFVPFLSGCVVREVSWEDTLDGIAAVDSRAATEFGDFYAQCLRFNPFRPRQVL